MHINSTHYLEDDPRVDKRPLTKALSSPPEFRNPNMPDTIIIHYTAMASYEAAIKSLSDYVRGAKNASAHLVIGKDGKMAQLAPFNYKTWHAGTSKYNGRTSLNSYSIGIEIDNLGWLKPFEENGETFYSRLKIKDRADSRRQKDEIYEGRHWNPKFYSKYWDKYTDGQVNAVSDICALLCERYDIKQILGHDEIAIDRKLDPGPAFPLAEMRNEILNFDRQDEDEEADTEFGEPIPGKVTASSLNVRAFAGKQAPKVALPLPRDTKVKIVGQSDEWYKIRTEIEGWVSADFIQKA